MVGLSILVNQGTQLPCPRTAGTLPSMAQRFVTALDNHDRLVKYSYKKYEKVRKMLLGNRECYIKIMIACDEY